MTAATSRRLRCVRADQALEADAAQLDVAVGVHEAGERRGSGEIQDLCLAGRRTHGPEITDQLDPSVADQDGLSRWALMVQGDDRAAGDDEVGCVTHQCGAPRAPGGGGLPAR